MSFTISANFAAQPGQADPTQLTAVFQTYGAITSSILPAPSLTVFNTDGLGKTYFRSLGSQLDGSVLYCFQCDAVPDGFVGTVLFTYVGSVIANLELSPSPASVTEVDWLPADLIASLGGVMLGVVSPVGRGGLVVSQGGSYLAANNNPLDFVKPAAALWPIDLSHGYSSFTLTLTKSNDNANPVPPGGSNPLVIAGNYLTATGSQQSARFEMTTAQSQQLAIGGGTRGYDMKITCSDGTNTIVLIQGQCSVTP